MESIHPLKRIVSLQKKGIPRGIYSVCSANEYVIEAAMEKALYHDSYVLIEATANQVNQFGGYTGMKPADFRKFIFNIAEKITFPEEMIILGGDHLGPLVWKAEAEEQAMGKACEMVREYVKAGFTKIHIDTSMRLGDDNVNEKLNSGLIALRGADICRAAEEAFEEYRQTDPEAPAPVYVVGSEVPIPGGSIEAEEGISITGVSDFEETISAFKAAFEKSNLYKAWENVIAVVVQPGVEFGDDFIHEYDRSAAVGLTGALKNHKNLVLEGHSTDYQRPESLKRMVEDGIAFLKVGPALTFALREGLFMLNEIEEEMFKDTSGVVLSKFIVTLEDVMAKNPDNWKKYYHGDDRKVRISRRYSYSDRCRYYLPVEEVSKSIKTLVSNLRKETIPLTLLSQYMPTQYLKVREGRLSNDPEAILKDRICDVIEDYNFATIPGIASRKVV